MDQDFLADTEKAYLKDEDLVKLLQRVQNEPAAYQGRYEIYGHFLWEVSTGLPRLYIPDDELLKDLIISEFHNCIQFEEQYQMLFLLPHYYLLFLALSVLTLIHLVENPFAFHTYRILYDLISP